MNFGISGFYVSSHLDESGKAIEHFAGSNFIPAGVVTFNLYALLRFCPS